jgi:hypothetical protein
VPTRQSRPVRMPVVEAARQPANLPAEVAGD